MIHSRQITTACTRQATRIRATITTILPSEACENRWRNAGEKLGNPPGILWADELHKRAISAYSVAMSVHRQQVYRSMIRPVMCLLSDVIQAQSLRQILADHCLNLGWYCAPTYGTQRTFVAIFEEQLLIRAPNRPPPWHGNPRITVCALSRNPPTYLG
jgi:hypothetical protein